MRRSSRPPCRCPAGDQVAATLSITTRRQALLTARQAAARPVLLTMRPAAVQAGEARSEEGGMADETGKGLRKGLTSYGDAGFSLFLRKAFIKAMGYSDDALNRPIVGITNTHSDYNP